MSPLDGASLIYNKIILPLFLKNQSKIDKVLDKGRGMVDRGLNEAAKIASDLDSKKAE